MAKSKSDISLNDLKAMLPHEGSPAEQVAALRALSTLSPEDRDLLAAVQESPFRLTTLEQFREFPANTEYFILEANISKVEDVGWRYLAQHLDTLLPPELLDAIDPVPFGKYAVQEEQGCFTSRGYLTLSGDEWQHDPTRGSLSRSCKEVRICPIMNMTKIIPLPPSSPTWASTTRATWWANG